MDPDLHHLVGLGRAGGLRRPLSFVQRARSPSPASTAADYPALGWGKRAVAARRVARYGTGYQTISSTPEAVREEVQLVRAELEARGRQPSEVTVSMLGPAVRIGGPKDAAPG